jgi:ubiquinone/menaquinone biosynthesis C-methylase UbiE
LRRADDLPAFLFFFLKMKRTSRPDPKATEATRKRYERIAPVYDLMEVLPEQRYRSWRQRLWSLVQGTKVLEVGVGTGKNMPFYPGDVQVTAIDLTPGMLEKAQTRARELGLDVDLRLGDVQDLEFPDETFDTVVSTCVFCSVPDPILGLHEVLRVLRPGGRLLMIEHVRSENPLLGNVMDLLNPVVVRSMGPNINRHTVENVDRAGLIVDRVEDLGLGDIFKLIVARREDHG